MAAGEGQGRVAVSSGHMVVFRTTFRDENRFREISHGFDDL